MTTDPLLERLHVDVPTLEPDLVLLSRLAAASSAAPAPGRPGLGRRPLPTMLLAAASVAVVAVLGWGLSQIPGGGSPAPQPVQSPDQNHQVPSRPPGSPHPRGAATPRERTTERSGASVLTTPAPGSSPGSGPSSTADSGHRDHSDAKIPTWARSRPGRGVHGGPGWYGDNNPGRHRGHPRYPEKHRRGAHDAGHAHQEHNTDP